MQMTQDVKVQRVRLKYVTADVSCINWTNVIREEFESMHYMQQIRKIMIIFLVRLLTQINCIEHSLLLEW